MPLPAEPIDVTDIIQFDGQKEGAAVIRYDVPLPGMHTGRRIIALDLGLSANDFKPEAMNQVSKSFEALGWTKSANSNTWTYGPNKALDFFFTKVKDAGLSTNVAYQFFEKTIRQLPLQDDGKLAPAPQHPPVNPAWYGQWLPAWTTLVGPYEAFRQGLPAGSLALPVKDWSGQVETVTQTADEAFKTDIKDTHLVLVETYGISSFLGNYGLGRTIRTFSLLPGEETKISIKTWRSSSKKVAEASSIVDSFTDAAAERFTNTVHRETTDKRTRNSEEKWHVQAEVKAGWGWGSAKVSGGASGEYQQSRETFASQVQDAVQEHSSQASSARDTTVTSSTERTEETGEETVTERTIRNVNLRRVLNFVFRELNQEYITRIHLLNVTVAFTNGTENSFREVPLSGLRGLLEEVLTTSATVNRVASDILQIAGTVMDVGDKPVPTLQRINRKPDGTYEIAEKVRDGDRFPSPPADRSFLYRFKGGPLGQQENDPFKVDGVVLKERKIVMRTESVAVEALLGKADALDSYSTHSQLAEVEAKQLANDQKKVALEILAAINDPKERAVAYAQMFNPPTARSALPSIADAVAPDGGPG